MPRGPSLALSERSWQRSGSDAVVSESDEDENLDDQGAWDHAFCSVCDCRIETGDGVEASLDEDAFAAAALSSLRRHAMPTHKPGASSKVPPREQAQLPLFCSEQCRRKEREKNAHMGEFMKYVATSRPQSLSTTSPLVGSLRRPGAAQFAMSRMSRTLHDAGPGLVERWPRPEPAATDALSDSGASADSDVLHGDSNSALSSSSESHDAPPRRRRSQVSLALRPARVRVPPSRGRGAPSNLARSRGVVHSSAAEAAPVAHGPRSPPDVPEVRSPPDALEARSPALGSLYDGTPSPSVVFGGRSVDAPAPAPAPIMSVTSSRAPYSPLDLLGARATPRAEPVACVNDDKVHTVCGASVGTGRSLRTAAAALRATQRHPSSSPSSRAESRGSSCGPSLSVSPASALHSMRAPWRYADESGDVSSDAPRSPASPLDDAASGARPRSVRSAQGVGRRRGRDVRVLPPLLGLSAPHGDDDVRSSAASTRSSWRGSSVDLAMAPRGSAAPSSLHAALGTSPRRAGLGWSALPSLAPDERRAPGAGGGGDAAEPPSSGAAVPPRTWSYDHLEGMRMYPLMQLPSAPVHDTYLPTWRAPEAADPPAPPVSASLPAFRARGAPRDAAHGTRSGHRKSLFFFDG